MADDKQKLAANAPSEANKSFDKREADLEAREAKLEERQERFEQTRDLAETQIADRSAALKQASTMGGTDPMASLSGEAVHVKRGEAIANRILEGGSDLARGGWFKCGKEESPSYSVPLIAIANEDFAYDSKSGKPFHTVNCKAWKRYYKDPSRNQIVSDGFPAPKPDLLDSSMLVQPGAALYQPAR